MDIVLGFYGWKLCLPEEHGCAPEFKDLMDMIIEEEDLQCHPTPVKQRICIQPYCIILLS